MDTRGDRMSQNYSTAQVAQLLGVSDQSVANWIDQRKLRAAHTPGGHRRVARGDLVEFLTSHEFSVPPELAGDAAPVILVVYGDPAATARLSKAIRSQRPDCRVLTASDGYSAGEIVIAEKPDVVLLDLSMPGLDGAAVCKRIRSHPATRRTVVVAVASHRSPKAERKLRKAGAAACLSQPVAPNQLHQALRLFLPANPPLTAPAPLPGRPPRVLAARLPAEEISKSSK
jgi:two-component system, OmpR family, response regulator VicR